MREILFRGKHGNHWVYGSLITGKYPSITSLENGEKTQYSVEEDTIGQFTGMVDATNKKIFENDICKQYQGAVGFIRFDYGWAIDYGNRSHDMPQRYCDYIKVVGNLDDNPELVPS